MDKPEKGFISQDTWHKCWIFYGLERKTALFLSLSLSVSLSFERNTNSSGQLKQNRAVALLLSHFDISTGKDNFNSCPATRFFNFFSKYEKTRTRQWWKHGWLEWTGALGDHVPCQFASFLWPRTAWSETNHVLKFRNRIPCLDDETRWSQIQDNWTFSAPKGWSHRCLETNLSILPELCYKFSSKDFGQKLFLLHTPNNETGLLFGSKRTLNSASKGAEFCQSIEQTNHTMASFNNILSAFSHC